MKTSFVVGGAGELENAYVISVFEHDQRDPRCKFLVLYEGDIPGGESRMRAVLGHALAALTPAAAWRETGEYFGHKEPG